MPQTQTPYKRQLKKELAEAARVAQELLPKLEGDPDWPLVTGQEELDTADKRALKRRALTRLTKKAVRLLHPFYKVSVRAGKGTAYRWVYVTLMTPEQLGVEAEYCLRKRTKDVLNALPLKYATYYYSDYGPGSDIPFSCVLVETRWRS